MIQPPGWGPVGDKPGTATLLDFFAEHQIRIQGTSGHHALNWSCTCQRLAKHHNQSISYRPLGLVDAPIEVILERYRAHVTEAMDAKGDGRHARRVPRRLGVLRGRR